MLEAYRLGASLYVPVTHKDVLPIANGTKWPELRSVIFCTEDAVAAKSLGAGLDNLRACLEQMSVESAAMRFVRVRNPEILSWLLDLPGVDKLDGFVLPKLDLRNVHAYMEPLRGTRFLCMPTLETPDVFDPDKMALLRDHLLEEGCQDQVLALRIGGNDLLALLGIRRPRDRTIYRTPLGHTIANLVTVFKPHGFQLTAPVFEHIDRPEILREELRDDVAHGLCGKTAIHPSQIPIIESELAIPEIELEAARRILTEDQAVFKLNGSMCEVATHQGWAQSVLQRTGMDS